MSNEENQNIYKRNSNINIKDINFNLLNYHSDILHHIEENSENNSVDDPDENRFLKMRLPETEKIQLETFSAGYWKLYQNRYLILAIIYVILTYIIIVKYCFFYKFQSLFYTLNTELEFHKVSYVYYNFFIIILAVTFYNLIRVSISNSGDLHDEYKEIYSLKLYYDKYNEYYKHLIDNIRNNGEPAPLAFPMIFNNKLKQKNDDLNNHNQIIEINNKFSTLIENPNDSNSQNLIIENQVEKENDDEVFDEKKVIDQQNEYEVISLNNKLKKLEYFINALRISKRYKSFWKLDCYNFKHSSLKDNVCRFCNIIKPERVFHCRYCRKCIRKMDHHCFVVNNCIGYYNYKLFLNLLINTFITSLFCFYICLESLDKIELNLDEFILISLYSISVFTCIIMISYYLTLHLFLIFTGYTQVEYMFKFYLIYDEYFYKITKNKTAFQKFKEVFGKNPIYWFLPIVPDLKENGYTYINK